MQYGGQLDVLVPALTKETFVLLRKTNIILDSCHFRNTNRVFSLEFPSHLVPAIFKNNSLASVSDVPVHTFNIEQIIRCLGLNVYGCFETVRYCVWVV
jgi:hypothetical protein